jgi:hypothetical protein
VVKEIQDTSSLPDYLQQLPHRCWIVIETAAEAVLLCPCGGRRVVLAFITEKKVGRTSPRRGEA